MRVTEKSRGNSKRPRTENLALLYQGLLTGIVRMQSGRQHVSDAETFRNRTNAALAEVERDAISVGYEGADIQETHFAVVAFLDSVVLNSKEPIRAEWERRTLQEELFGQTDAGVVFFEKLDRMRSRRDSQELADVLEVYLLCLLLGFEGRYAGGLRGEIYSIQDKVKMRIRDMRGSSSRISPAGLPADAGIETGVVPTAPKPIPYLYIAFAAILFTAAFFVAAELHLWSVTDAIRGMLS